MAQQSARRHAVISPSPGEFAPHRSFIILAACGLSMMIFIAGILTSLNGTDKTHIRVTLGLAVAVIAAGVVGRLVSVAVQLEVITGAIRGKARERVEKVLLLGIVIYAQLPLVIRDCLLGVAGITKIVSYGRLLSLSGSIFDPFVLASCIFFCRLVYTQRDPGWSRRSACMAFIGYSVVAKLIEGFLMGFLAHAS